MSAIPATATDVVNRILGVADDSPIVALRNQKPLLIAELQAYYDSIFAPELSSAEAFPVRDRALIAARVATHTRSKEVVAWYADLAREAGASEEIIASIQDIATPSQAETSLGAAIRHADLLTAHLSDARDTDLQALKDAGFSPAGILSLSQTIAFVSYQLRLIAGLRAFGAQS